MLLFLHWFKRCVKFLQTTPFLSVPTGICKETFFICSIVLLLNFLPTFLQAFLNQNTGKENTHAFENLSYSHSWNWVNFLYCLSCNLDPWRIHLKYLLYNYMSASYGKFNRLIQRKTRQWCNMISLTHSQHGR